MSLIADALNKLKKEQKEEHKDDAVMAPPALRNAVVNTKKYKDFVEKSSLQDINGKKPNLKGFIAVSSIVVVIISVTVFFFLKKENDSLTTVATIDENAKVTSPVEKPAKKEEKPNTTADKTAPKTQVADSHTKMPSTQDKEALKPAPQKAAEKPKSENVAVSKNDNNISKEVPVKQAENNSNDANIVAAQQLFFVSDDGYLSDEEFEALFGNKKEREPKNQASVEVKKETPKEVKAPIKQAEPVQVKKAEPVAAPKVEPAPKKELEKAAPMEQVSAAQNRSEKVPAQAPVNNIDNDTIKDIPVAEEIKVEEYTANIADTGNIKDLSSSETILYNKYITSGNKAMKSNNLVAALEYYQNALGLKKDDTVIGNIAKIYLAQNNPNMAFQTVVASGLTSTKVIKVITVDMINAKYLTEASKMLQYANTLDKSHEILFTNGYFYDRKGDYTKSLRYYQEALSMKPKDSVYMYYTARALEYNKDYKNALVVYKELLKQPNLNEKMKAQAEEKVSKIENMK